VSRGLRQRAPFPNRELQPLDRAKAVSCPAPAARAGPRVDIPLRGSPLYMRSSGGIRLRRGWGLVLLALVLVGLVAALREYDRGRRVQEARELERRSLEQQIQLEADCASDGLPVRRLRIKSKGAPEQECVCDSKSCCRCF
jgi:hypothetical protein